MKMIWGYAKKYWLRACKSMTFRLFGTIFELLIPYIFEYVIDYVAPEKDFKQIILWGFAMVFCAVGVRVLYVAANRSAASVSRDCIQEIRYDLFKKTANLSGPQFDSFGLPSLISRMTSDSYNVQNFITRIQTMGVRTPIMLIGGVFITMTMDPVLAMILCVIIPILGFVIFFVSRHGVPLFSKVQQSIDDVVRVMRENITGIRVIKALSKTDYEIKRFKGVNDELTKNDLKANTMMAIPGPFMQLCLNIGLTLVIIFGAQRVNTGAAKPGVILAFLTYFNQILMAVMSLNRMFMLFTRTTASANRIALILNAPEDQPVIAVTDETKTDDDAHIIFDDVTFDYTETKPDANGEIKHCLENISFKIKRGESLGIIGATGSGKTTIINLLMRFYDAQKGRVYVDGRDVRTFDKDELREKFGVVFQNDVIFADSLYNNIAFGRNVSLERVKEAAKDAMVADYIDTLEEGYEYKAAVKGANLSGGQKQRLLIARALAAKPDILILDDSSSALDYKTDASLRKAINEHYQGSTTIMVAQRVSSIMNMTNILFLDDGKIVSYGTHEQLMENCEQYRQIYEQQMGALD